MSIQGPTIVVAEHPAPDLVDALRAAGAFPVVETTWADAPTAFNSIKPVAIVLAEVGPPVSEASARMLCLQVATAVGPVVPIVARAQAHAAAPLPIALCIDVAAPIERLIARLTSALRIRSLHAAALRRMNGQTKRTLRMPVGDPLDDATLLAVGRTQLYPDLSAVLGSRVGLVAASSFESAKQQLDTRDIDGIVVGEGYPLKMVDGFLTMLAQEPRFRDIPAVIASDVPADLAAMLPNVDGVTGDIGAAAVRLLPLVRMHALGARMQRVLNSLDADGMFDPDTGLLLREAFASDFGSVVEETTQGGGALSLARFAFDGAFDRRASRDAARLLSRLVRKIDFACLEEDGSILLALTQTDLKSAHVVVRRAAALLKQAQHDSHVTLATLKAGDNAGSLLMRVMSAQAVAAE